MIAEEVPLHDAKQLVKETVHIMNNNVKVLYEREAKLDELDQRAEDLEDNALAFQKQSRRLKMKYKWQNYVLFSIICLLIFILLISVIIWVTEG